MFSVELLRQAEALLELCKAKGVRVATAESCTGGLIIACLTEIPGSSAVVDRGFVTYDNGAKIDLLGVPAALFETVGAASEEVSRAMAEGALPRSSADIAVSCTGIAGPSGATPGKPVGYVHLACAAKGKPTLHVQRNYGDIGRGQVRARTTEDAFGLIRQQLDA